MMLQSNRMASVIAMEEGVSAATDITGFGLAGHLLEMCQQSEVSVELNVDSLPLIFGAARQILNGIQSSLYDENRAAVQDFLVIGDDRICDNTQHGAQNNSVNVDATLLNSPLLQLSAMYDPQTSGGLLLGVDTEQADRVLARLVAAGYRDAAIIGHVADRSVERFGEGSTTVRIDPTANCRPH